MGSIARSSNRHDAEDSAHVNEALNCAYLEQRPGLVRYLRQCGGSDAAQDLAQEVFLRAASSSQAGSLINPAGFLYRIARNILIDRARRARCRQEPLPLIEALDAPCAPEQEYGLAADELQAAFDRALSVLSPHARRVFVMHRFDGKPYRTIHEELGISVATVEYHMMKALAHLRKELAEYA